MSRLRLLNRLSLKKLGLLRPRKRAPPLKGQKALKRFPLPKTEELKEQLRLKSLELRKTFVGRSKGRPSVIRPEEDDDDDAWRPPLPQSVWRRHTRKLGIAGLVLGKPVSRSTARLMVLCDIIAENLCPDYVRAYRKEVKLSVREYFYFRRGIKAGKVAPLGFHGYVWHNSRWLCYKAPTEFRRIVSDGRFRRILRRRFPVYLGSLVRHDYAELLTLLRQVRCIPDPING